MLLGKRHPKRSDLNVLSPLLDLLTCKANTSVSSFIMEMVEKLVTTVDYGGTDDYHRDDNEETVMIRPDFCFEVPPITIEFIAHGAYLSSQNCSSFCLLGAVPPTGRF